MSWFFIGRSIPVVAETPILDTYPGAIAAYSVARKLRTGVTSPFRANYGGGGASTYDADFTSGNITDTAALLAAVGSAAKIGTLYDQSTNAAHLANGTDSARPTVVASSAVKTVNGIIAAEFDGGDSLNTSGSVPTFGTTLGVAGDLTVSTFLVFQRQTALGGGGGIFGWGDTGTALRAFGFFSDTSISWVAYAGGHAFPMTLAANATHYLLTLIKTPGAINTTSTARRNGSSVASGSPSTGTPNINGSNPLVFGDWANFGSPMGGYLQELIIYASDKTSDMSAIETNIMSFYGI